MSTKSAKSSPLFLPIPPWLITWSPGSAAWSAVCRVCITVSWMRGACPTTSLHSLKPVSWIMPQWPKTLKTSFTGTSTSTLLASSPFPFHQSRAVSSPREAEGDWGEWACRLPAPNSPLLACVHLPLISQGKKIGVPLDARRLQQNTSIEFVWICKNKGATLK